MSDRPQRLEDQLSRRMSRIAKVFDVNRFIEEKWAPQQIGRYYDANRLAYLFLHSYKGAVHFGINPGGRFGKRSLYAQVRDISSLISEQNFQTVIEPGCGKGFNLSWLARRHPGTQFLGLDISAVNLAEAKRRCKSLSNVQLRYGDYHGIDVDSDSFDCVCMVESACFSHNHEQMVKEVRRILKPGGVWVVYDIFRGSPVSQIPADWQRICDLTERSIAIPKGEGVQEWLQVAETQGFTLVEFQDLTSSVIPNLRNFERYSGIFFASPAFARLGNQVLPSSLTRNTIAGYLMPLTMRAGYQKYIKAVMVNSL
jgi:ubiquinone/menaquinone biosynthesis C-methylase UbiE